MHDGHALKPVDPRPDRAPAAPTVAACCRRSLGLNAGNVPGNRLAEINVERQPRQATSMASSPPLRRAASLVPAGNPALLKVSDLTTGYGNSAVLDRIGLEVGEREAWAWWASR